MWKKSLLAAGRYIECPYYDPEYVIKSSPAENLEWRIKVHEAALRDRGLQRDLRQAAFEDVLFFFNAFAWCFEPRAVNKVRPFCSWSHQDPVILKLDKAIQDSEYTESPIDVVIDKSRGQGATWMYLLIFLRRWLRDELFSAGLVSRNEKLVDSLRDPDTLMWKICWAIKMLPSWLMPKGFDWSRCRNLSEHSLANPDNGATIVGYSATGDVARGGRKTVFSLDELAAFKAGEDYAALDSTAHVTNCRFLVSTYMGDSGAYYDAATQEGNAIKIVLDWHDNPTQNKCLYRLIGNRTWDADPRPGSRLGPNDFVIIREQHAMLRKRGHKVEDKLRNIWYNRQCLRPGARPQGIAQELDRDPRGSVSKMFNGETLKQVRAECCRAPLIQGRLVYDSETAEVRKPFLVEDSEGDLKLWIKPQLDGEIPMGLYSVGTDIAAGLAGDYSSNSVAFVIDRMTGEQVAEWVSNCVIPAKFAYVSVALCRWFHDAILVPEANYSASYMNLVVEDIGYPNVYRRKVDIVGVNKITDKPGFWMKNDDTKMRVFETMQEAMAEGSFTPRSQWFIDECLQYEWRNGRVVHIGSVKSLDQSGKGKAHGDRTVAAALAWVACAEEPILQDDDEHPVMVPEGSMAERLKILDEAAGLAGDPWDTEALDIFDRVGISCADDWT